MSIPKKPWMGALLLGAIVLSFNLIDFGANPPTRAGALPQTLKSTYQELCDRQRSMWAYHVQQTNAAEAEAEAGLTSINEACTVAISGGEVPLFLRQ
jgi:hypothetical protein